MTLSIIVPAYNVEAYIAECLDSLLDQGLQDHEYEIIIVNDGSTDNTLKVAEQYALKNAQIKVITKPNGGAGSARNCGLDAAIGTYLYFIDPDDFLLPNCLKKLVETAIGNNLEVLTFLSASFSKISPKGKPILEKSKNKLSFTNDLLSPIVTGIDYVAKVNYKNEVWWYLINHKFIKDTGIRFPEGQWMEDTILTLKLFLKVKRLAHIQMDVHRHRTTPGSAMTSFEPNHYMKVIRDMQDAVVVFNPVIQELEDDNANADCIERVKIKQQSLVFFSMIRMLRSSMTFEEVKQRVNQMTQNSAYPLDSFFKKDYNGMVYQVMVPLINNKRRYLLLFRLLNPALKLRATNK